MTPVVAGPSKVLRVLITEDRPADAELTVARLQQAGYEPEWERVQTADDMRVALGARTWDVVISDFSMPEFDAYEALAVLRESGLDLPFIIVSGTIGEDIAVEAMRRGAHDYFLKGRLMRLPAAIAREVAEAGHRRAERSMRRALEALHEIAFAAGAPPDPARLARYACDRARELLETDLALVYEWDESAGVLRLLAERDDGVGVHVPVLKPDEGVAGPAFLQQQPIAVDDYEAPPPGIRPPRTGLTGSALAVPLVAGSQRLGAFAVRSLRPGHYGADAVRTLTLLAAQVAPSIALARAFEEARRRAMHDPLTGLPNRSFLSEELKRQLAPGDRPTAVLLANINSFRVVNGALGRRAGDDLLRQAADRLRSGVGPASFPAHLGGDEFAVLLGGRDTAGALASAERMLRGLDEPFTVNGQAVALTVSIGIAVAPEHGTEPELLLRRAEIAVQSAKRSGSSVKAYAPVLEEHTAEDLALVGELGGAIADDRLVLHYQPQVDLRDMRTVGYEALVRWQHPSLGLLAPAAFVPLAERMGFARSLFRWVLRTALREVSYDGPLHAGAVALNVSIRNLLDVELPVVVEEALRASGWPPGSLVLEITEQDVMTDPGLAVEVLQRLRDLRVRLSVDDFGTGYSSMAYLQRLPVDELKIDRTFLAGVPRDRRNVAIVRATIDLAQGLGLTSLAEGVEDEAALSVLGTLGCDRAQGYYLGRPLPAGALRSLGAA